MPTLGTSGIFFDEMDGSPSFDGNIKDGLFTVTQVGLMNWSDINAMTAYLMAPTLVFGQLFGVFAGAAFPDNANLRCMDFKYEPFDMITGATTNGVNVHTVAKCTIKYTNVKAPFSQQQTQDPVAMLVHEYDVGGEMFVPSKKGNLAWGSDGSPYYGTARGAIFVPTTEMSITWPRIPYNAIPGDAIDNLRGKVNQFTVTFSTGTCAPETLLFLGAKVRMDAMSTGDLGWALTYKFSKRTVIASDIGSGTSYGTQGKYGGWNHHWRSDINKVGWYRVVRVFSDPTSSGSVYNYAPFQPLFPGSAVTW